MSKNISFFQIIIIEFSSFICMKFEYLNTNFNNESSDHSTWAHISPANTQTLHVVGNDIQFEWFAQIAWLFIRQCHGDSWVIQGVSEEQHFLPAAPENANGKQPKWRVTVEVTGISRTP